LDLFSERATELLLETIEHALNVRARGPLFEHERLTNVIENYNKQNAA